MDAVVRVDEAERFCVSLDDEAAILLRDALYADASSQSSSEACDLIWSTFNQPGEIAERTISKTVAADLLRGIEIVTDLYGSWPALIELRDNLRRSFSVDRPESLL